jgi:transposase
VQNSNQTEHLGRITKRGTKLGRTILVQCALIAKRYSSHLDRFYERIRARRGTGKAIIALARKFLGIIYHTLKNNWIFEDFPNFVLAEATQ